MTPDVARVRVLFFARFALVALALHAPAALAQVPECSTPIGRVVSIEGSVELRRSNATDWVAVRRLDTRLCEDDAIRTRERSRAAIWVSPENIIRLDRSTAVRLTRDAEGQRVVDFFTDPGGGPDPECGAAYFVSRFPRKLKVRTPFVNAAVEGTEFLVRAECNSGTVYVYEGRVLVQALASSERIELEGGSGVSGVGSGGAPPLRITVKPRDGVQWALFYPRLGPREDGAGESSEACIDAVLAQRATCERRNAEAALSVGATDEAAEAISRLRAIGPEAASEADALEAVRRVVIDDRAGALAAARTAVAAGAATERAWIALSYARQASRDLEGALAAAQEAVRRAPQAPVARAREAEMLLVTRTAREARRAADEAERLAPGDALVLQVAGFVRLAELDGPGAQRRFEAAVAADPGDPRARFGLGLSRIRQGKLEPGREDLEIAVALDPGNALLRTYLGRAYFEENTRPRDALAASQYGMARRLDPDDPTPWFYQSLLSQATSQPVQALDEMRRSRELNGNRAVYRSASALDQDAATRSTALSRQYLDLGFEQNAVTEATRALSEDPSSFTAHQYMSDSYAFLPRHQYARASAGLQAQLRQPLGAETQLLGMSSMSAFTPDRPFLSLDTIGPGRGGLYDFDPVFSPTGVRGRVRGLAGEYGTTGLQLSGNGVFDSSAIGVGYSRTDTNGIRTNNDQLRDAYSAVATFRPNSDLTLQGEVQQYQADFGDLPLRFDPNYFSKTDRYSERFTAARAGARYALSAESEVLGSVVHSEGTADFVAQGGLPKIVANTSYSSGELQYVRSWVPVKLTMGAGFLEGSRRDFIDFSLPGVFTLQGQTNTGDRHASAYAYATSRPVMGQLRLTAGFSYDDADYGSLQRAGTKLNPKFGAVWEIAPDTVVRVAYMRLLQKPFFAGLTLEPVQVAGFSQFYEDVYGSYVRRWAGAIDHAVNNRLFVGAGGSRRWIDSPYSGIDPFTLQQTRAEYGPWDERETNVYGRWIVTPQVVLSGQVYREYFSRKESYGTAQFQVLRQWRVPVSVQYQSPSGFGAYARATYLDQSGTFCRPTDTTVCTLEGSERSTLLDVGAGYRFPGRSMALWLDVMNAFDEEITYQSLDMSRFAAIRGRAAFARLSIMF